MAIVDEDAELFDEQSRPRSGMSMASVSDEVNEILVKLKKVAETKNPEYQDNLKLFVQDWRDQTTKEAAGLEKLKNRVLKRRVIREEEDKLLREMREREETLRLEEAEESKVRKQEEKLRRIELAETKRQKLIEESKEKKNYTIVTTGREMKSEEASNEREPSAEEISAMKSAALSVRIKPLGIEGLHKERLKRRATEVWEQLVKIEAERYDLEERAKRQDYDLKELKERQKQQLRSRAMKLGLPPEALTGKYPPKIMVASKYERRAGLKPFGETKDLFEGGFLKQYRETVDKTWMDRQELFTKKDKDQMPPWLEDMPRRTRIEDLEGDKEGEGEGGKDKEGEVGEEGVEVEEVEEAGEEAEDAGDAEDAGEEGEDAEDAGEEGEDAGEETEDAGEEVEEAEDAGEEAEDAGEEAEEEELLPIDPDVILEDPEGEAEAEAEEEEEEEEAED